MIGEIDCINEADKKWSKLSKKMKKSSCHDRQTLL